jgi:hypothetical protein
LLKNRGKPRKVHLNNIYKFSSSPKKTQNFYITRINWLTLFNEIIAAYFEYHTKPINTIYWQNKELINVKTSGTYNQPYQLSKNTVPKPSIRRRPRFSKNCTATGKMKDNV